MPPMLEQSKRWIEHLAGGVGAADTLRTAVAPTWRDIGQLAAIAVLRTGLNYSLELEIARGRQGPHLCSPGQFLLASSMCFGMASDHVFFTPLL